MPAERKAHSAPPNGARDQRGGRRGPTAGYRACALARKPKSATTPEPAHNTYLSRASLELMRQLFSWATDFVEIAKIISLDTGARLSLCRQNNGPDGSAIFSERAVRLVAGQMQVKSSSSDRELEQTTD